MSVELVEVSKVVGSETHIRSVSMKLDPGSLNVLLGPTLSGKTSLMRLMAGLDEPTSGRVLANGRDVTGVPVRKRDVAMVYQQFINYPTLSVYENIASPLRVARRPKEEIDREVREAAELLKITDMLQRTPLELSGGQQQRTALARALVKGPISCCWTSRWQTSTTSCARSCARSCRGCSARAARSWSMPRPSPRRLCCWAATPPPFTKGRSRNSGRRSRSIVARMTC
ncbi:ABC transporter ATP-binding protein [Fodinicurvata halophila]|uniref:ABC transporter ATP-binding protein n=1 Tax=Fodinicurvata halophila TaxID=1419723 RepID=UPI0036353B1E